MNTAYKGTISCEEHRTILRKEKIAARDAIPGEVRLNNSKIICQKLFELPIFQQAKKILLYSAVRGEVSLSSLEEINRAAPKIERKCYAYPICKGKEMIAVIPGSSDTKGSFWRRGAFGISEPDPEKGEILFPEELDLVVCPCTAFDSKGGRLGMGGGYYDRYLPKCVNAEFIAVAFEVQKADSIPVESWDIPIHFVQTEQTLYHAEYI